MNSNGSTRKLAALFAVALAAIAASALPSVAAAKHHHGRDHHRWEKRHRRILGGEESAGRIQSFDPASGRLVIALFNEETVSGLVTEATEIECGHGSASASDMGSGEDEGEDPGEHEGGEEAGEGDHSGPGEAGEGEAGEEEPGDDAGEHGGMPGPPEGEAGGCTAADLTEGAVVKEAELKVEGGSASFEKVELAG